MNQMTFEALQNRIQQLYQDGDYRAALNLATEAVPNFPDHSALLYYWRISMTARLGDTGSALRLLEAALGAGLWYGEVLLRQSPSWKPLQGLPEFERLVERSHALQAAEHSALFPLITLRPEGECGAGDLPCPLLIGLHGNTATAQGELDFWKQAAGAGWLVAAPQSSQAVWRQAYVWDDLETARAEILHHHAALKNQYSVDPQHVVLAGHSMGAEVAIWLALTGAIETRGFIAVGHGGPFLDEPGSWLPYIEQGKGRGLSGYFIVGAKDETIPQQNISILLDMLTEAGIPCNLEVVPGAGHDYVPEFSAGVLRGLGFITEDEDAFEDPSVSSG
jgi:predicted esterase